MCISRDPSRHISVDKMSDVQFERSKKSVLKRMFAKRTIGIVFFHGAPIHLSEFTERNLTQNRSMSWIFCCGEKVDQ